jgi:hypothetical protein
MEKTIVFIEEPKKIVDNEPNPIVKSDKKHFFKM